MTDDGNPPLGFVGSHAGGPQDGKNMGLEHSISPQDVKYQFTWQTSYDLPIGKSRALNLNGVANAIFGDWTADGVFYLSSGIPIASPTVNAPISYFNQRPNLDCDPGKGAPHTAAQWFLPNCFSTPADNQSPFVAGNAPAYLDHVRTMGANDLDLTLSKSFKLGKERDLRFEISSFNVANKAAVWTCREWSRSFLSMATTTRITPTHSASLRRTPTRRANSSLDRALPSDFLLSGELPLSLSSTSFGRHDSVSASFLLWGRNLEPFLILLSRFPLQSSRLTVRPPLDAVCCFQA